MSRNRHDAALECIVYVLLTKIKQLRQFANTHGIGIYALAQVAGPLVPGELSIRIRVVDWLRLLEEHARR